MSVTVLADGLRDAQRYFEQSPDRAARAARMAINDTVSGKGLKLLRAAVGAQVNFPDGYLDGKDKLFVSKRAFDHDLEAVITGRFRPTSLARFVTSGITLGRTKDAPPVAVSVRAGGGATTIPNAFLVRLNAGASFTSDNFNLGLAIRLKEGERVTGRRKQQTQLSPGVALLYGPSVDQVFDDVAEEQGEAVIDLVQTEFLRQWVRMSNEEA